jgi:zinc transporter ZupT
LDAFSTELLLAKGNDLLVGFLLAFTAGNMLYITASEGVIELFEMGDMSKCVKLF